MNGRPRALAWSPLFLAPIVCFIPFVAYLNLILHGLYDIGGTLSDEGLFAFLLQSGDPGLHEPQVLGGASWFGNHVSPLVWTISQTVAGLHPSRVILFASVIGSAQGLMAFAVYWLLVRGFGVRTAKEVLISLILALGYGFNGLAIAITLFPHIESFFAGCAMMFLVALTLGRLRIATVFFILALSTREDCGFHLAGLLILLAALDRFRGVPLDRQRLVLGFALAGLVYSGGAVFAQHLVFPDRSLLAADYFGVPAFGHLSGALIGTRLVGWILYRGYVLLPAAIALVWAVRSRNPAIVLGYAAFLPWALLQLVAERPLIGTLPSYYAFPFLVAGFWPLVGILHTARQRSRPIASTEAMVGFAAMIAGSFAIVGSLHAPERLDIPDGFLALPSMAREAATDRGIENLARRDGLGHVLVDQSVLALRPELFGADQVLGDNPKAAADTILYFAHGPESDVAREAIRRNGLGDLYEVPDTEIRVATNRTLGQSGTVVPWQGAVDPSDTGQ